MRFAVLLLALSLLGGCSTPGDLKRDYPPVTFTVPAGYQLVLKRLVDRHKECAMAPLVPLGQVIDDVQNYPDLRSATIVRGSSGIGSQTSQVFEIREIGPNKTEVKFTQRFRVEAWAAYYERVANGGEGCEL